jgi:hypothetical protein
MFIDTVHSDDDHIETTLFTRFTGMSISEAEDAPASRARSPQGESEDKEGHGKTTQGTVACCRKYSEGQVNCNSCLNTALSLWMDQSDTKEQDVARGTLGILDVAGSPGLDMNTLLVSRPFTYLVIEVIRENLIRQRLRKNVVVTAQAFYRCWSP